MATQAGYQHRYAADAPVEPAATIGFAVSGINAGFAARLTLQPSTRNVLIRLDQRMRCHAMLQEVVSRDRTYGTGTQGRH